MEQHKLQYKDEQGNTLYGFSQTHLERTNARLNDISFALKVLIVLFIIMLIGVLALGGWIAYNDVLTRLIYGY